MPLMPTSSSSSLFAFVTRNSSGFPWVPRGPLGRDPCCIGLHSGSPFALLSNPLILFMGVFHTGSHTVLIGPSPRALSGVCFLQSHLRMLIPGDFYVLFPHTVQELPKILEGTRPPSALTVLSHSVLREKWGDVVHGFPLGFSLMPLLGA